MKYEILNASDSKKINRVKIEQLLALYEGGARFEQNINSFIVKGKQDNFDLLSKKLEIAKSCYTNYFAQVINYYVGFLFSYNMIYSSSKEASSDYEVFRENADGKGTDLHEVIRGAFTAALTGGIAMWSVEFPTDEESLIPRIKVFNVSNLVDWEFDNNGNLLWVITKQVENRRLSPYDTRLTTTEIFTVFDCEKICKYEITYSGKRPPLPTTDVPLVETVEHTLGCVPIIMMRLPEGLVIGEKIAPLQIRNFRQTLAHEWALNRTTYAIPIIKTDNPDISQIFNNQVNAIVLDQKGEFEYSVPPTEAIESIKAAMKQSKDELFRVANLNMLGVENNSYALVRSGLSRNIDASTAHKTLKAYGAIIREAVQKTLNLISKARNEDITWSVGGYEMLNDFDPETLVKILKDLNQISMPDVVIRELVKKLAMQLLADLSESEKAEVEKACNNLEIKKAEIAPPLVGSQLKVGQKPEKEPEIEDEPPSTQPSSKLM